jgi:uncharacterized membrane protein HdeD (DUF308 family)
MSSRTESEPLNPRIAECMRLKHCWGWFVGLGILLVLAGAAAVAYSCLVTLTTVVVFGWVLLAGGVVEIVNAFVAGSWRGFFEYLLGGVLHLVLGVFMIDRPERAAEILTLMLAVAFVVAGLFRIAGALRDHFVGWGWVLLNGVVTFALGVAIWRQWPGSSYFVIGLFVGIDLIFNGWSWVMLGLIVRAPAPLQGPHAPTREQLEAAAPAR